MERCRVSESGTHEDIRSNVKGDWVNDANVPSASGARTIQFRSGGPHVPLDLVRARDAGEVVFVVGAGASRGGLPSFEGLTKAVFSELAGGDPTLSKSVPHSEHSAFKNAQYDVALGLLEDRLDGAPSSPGRQPSRRVRDAVARALDADKASSPDRHKDLLILSLDLTGRPRIVTTNFDTLFERAWPLVCGPDTKLCSRAGGGLPGPGTPDFAGVLHLHGHLADPKTTPATIATDLVLTGADFGDAYLRSGWAARFIYDLVRRYQLVFVGYGAEDQPLKYLLNVISADRRRFSDLRTIYAFDSVGTDGDAVTQAWLAKGIKPLLYEADDLHTQLYGTLAEWAEAVDEPQDWANRRLQAAAGRTFFEADSEERSVVALLLASSTNCALFKSFGADFSWVRAIEDGRPSQVPVVADDNRVSMRDYGYLASLRAWLHGRLGEPSAMAWAVDRVDPPRQRKDDAAPASSDPAQQDDLVFTSHRGFTSDELSILDELIEREAKGLSAASRRFWSVLSQAARDDGHDLRGRYAYDIMERLSAEDGPDVADIERLARFLRPRLKIARPWRSSIGQSSADPSVAFDPCTLASGSLDWEGHPGQHKISAGLPNDARWLALLLRALEAELDRVYRLAALIGWLDDERDLLTLCTHRVATDVRWTQDPVDDEDLPSDPDRYHRDHRALIRVISGAWDRLAGLDPPAARQIAEGWRLRDEALYQRLSLHALRRADVFEAEDVVRTLVSLTDSELWARHAEMTLLIVGRWKTLPETDRTQLEDRFREGPPDASWLEGTTKEKQEWRRGRVMKLFAVLANDGGPLSSRSTQFLIEAAGQSGSDLTIDDLSPGGVQIRRVPEGDPSRYADIETSDLVAALEASKDKRGFGESDHAAAFVNRDPERSLLALLAAPEPFSKHGDLWRQLFWRVSEDGWIGEASIGQKRQVLDSILSLKDTALETALGAAVGWLEKCVVGRETAILPFLYEQQDTIVEAWMHLASHAFQLPGEPRDDRFLADQGERLIRRAYNSVAGELTFVALALIDRIRRKPTELESAAERVGELERAIRNVEGGARIDVAARLAEWAYTAIELMPHATEEFVLGPISDLEDEETLCLIDLHALYARGSTVKLYRRLEPIMVREAKRGRLSSKGVERLVDHLAWRVLDRLAGRSDAGLTCPELRLVLQRTSDEGRRAAADTVRRWLKAIPAADKSTAWTKTAKPFFDQCWAFDVALRSPGLSQELARIPALLGSGFSAGVATIAPLLVPFEVWDVDSLFRGLVEPSPTDEGQVIADDGRRREAVARVWSPAVDLLDAALGANPKSAPHDLSNWLGEIRNRVPEAVSDPRYKRLLRLTQR